MRIILVQKPPECYCVYLQVHEKMNKVAKKQQKGPEALEKFLQGHPVPVVLGPGQKRYLIDHHHLCCALHKMGVECCYAGAAREHLCCWKGTAAFGVHALLLALVKHNRMRALTPAYSVLCWVAD
jgi:hypothetical protein